MLLDKALLYRLRGTFVSQTKVLYQDNIILKEFIQQLHIIFGPSVRTQ